MIAFWRVARSNDRVELRIIACPPIKVLCRSWAVVHAAIEFTEAYFQVVGVEVDQPENPAGRAPDGRSTPSFEIRAAPAWGRGDRGVGSDAAFYAHAVGKNRNSDSARCSGFEPGKP